MVPVDRNDNDPGPGPDGGAPGTVDVAAYGRALADAVDAVLATWVVRCVHDIAVAWSGAVAPEVALGAEEAGQAAREEVGGAVRRLVEADLDDQHTTPLALLRTAVAYPTRVLAAAGVPPLERDRFAEEAFPDDPYDLTPANFAALDPSLADVGLAWGAAKAFEHKRRHRS
jgi:hypothetical protein